MRVQAVLSELNLYPPLHVTQLLLETQYIQFAMEQLESEQNAPLASGTYPSLQSLHVLLVQLMQYLIALIVHELMRHSVG